MADKTNEFSFESLQDCGSVASFLDAIKEGLAGGSLVLAADEKELTLGPQGLLRFKIRAKRGSYRSQIVLKISWREELPTGSGEASALTIKKGPSRGG